MPADILSYDMSIGQLLGMVLIVMTIVFSLFRWPRNKLFNTKCWKVLQELKSWILDK